MRAGELILIGASAGQFNRELLTEMYSWLRTSLIERGYKSSVELRPQ